jgi:tetratricopeptide (TPR) repeat protein
MRPWVRVCIFLLYFFCQSAMAIDLLPLWDFNKPDLSEQRFRKALELATGDDVLILQTQIARTYGLRKDFRTAQALLSQIAAAIPNAGAEVRVRYNLELGRSLASAAHAPEPIAPEARAQAGRAFEAALSIAKEARLDALAIDAVHMFAFLDKAPADQLRWSQAAFEIVQNSTQPDAKRWEPSVRSNLGYALHQLGRFEEALAQFQQAVVLRERGSNVSATRIAHWMVAWTLRSLNRVDEAIEIQLRLEKENDLSGQPDPFVFEELETLFSVKGDLERAKRYAKRRSK